MANSPCISKDMNNLDQNIQTVNFCNSFMFRTAAGSVSTARAMPNKGVGYVEQKIVNPYTGAITNKIGTTSGNDTTMSTRMLFSQYVNNPGGFRNVQTYSYNDYVAKFGPLPPSFNIPASTDARFQKSYK